MEAPSHFPPTHFQQIETDVPEGFHLKILPCCSSPFLSVFRNTKIMCTPPFLSAGAGGGRVEPPPKFSWRGEGIDRYSIFGGGLLGLMGGGWLRESCSFYIKNKLKSAIFNDKKVYKQKCLSVITKNLNRKILNKNLVTFKRWNGVENEKF